MKKKLKIIGLTILISLFGLLIYEFAYGKLFAFSPIIVGFNKIELQNTCFYIQNGADFNDFEKIDTLIPSVENFHSWKFLNKPKIFIFKDSLSYIKRSISKARFCVYPNSRLFITPWALKEVSENKISLEIYLKHELSHSLLYQHSGILNSYRYPKWLEEGIAVYSSNQFGTSFYPSKTKTYELIKNGNFMPPEYFKSKKEDDISINYEFPIGFMYSEFGCIVDYLIQTYGKDRFLNYIKQLTDDTNNSEIFKKIYNIEFDIFIQDFKKYASTK